MAERSSQFQSAGAHLIEKPSLVGGLGSYDEITGAQQTGFFRHEGRRVAYAVVGDGPPLVLPAWWVSNIAEDGSARTSGGSSRRLRVSVA